MTRIIAAAIVAFILIPSTAQARHHHHRYNYRHQIIRTDALPAVAYEGTSYGYGRVDSERTVIGSRPSGCPHAYCGCGLARYLGLHDVRLNLASAWARIFPHTSPTPGAVAVRSHHVMMLVSHVGGSNWIVRDYNGGRGLSYIHTRSVAGYTFVSPHGSRMAAI